MAITIGTAAPADSSQLASLLGQLGYPAERNEVENRLEYWLKDPQSALMVAEVADAIAGVAALHVFPLFERAARRGRLVALVVDDAFRGQGIGRKLVEAAENRARSLGSDDMEITSSRERVAAHEFYAALGYDDVCDRAARFMKTL